MSNKIKAKDFAVKIGLPIVPGSKKNIKDFAETTKPTNFQNLTNEIERFSFIISEHLLNQEVGFLM